MVIFRTQGVFNKDISRWDLSSAYSVGRMFDGAVAFEGDLSNWCFKTGYYIAELTPPPTDWSVDGKVIEPIWKQSQCSTRIQSEAFTPYTSVQAPKFNMMFPF